ncbi:cytochrome c [Pseudomonas sp.]|uniref:c-type cytochrome n=1 Tax=Pseudomonas sp. TaxID=306 RepID=UPI0031DA41E8
MSRKKLWVSAAVALGAGGLAVAFGLMWRPAIDPIDKPVEFDTAQIARGADVVTAGDCAVCHTRPGGKYLAGGLPLVTPFGTLYSTNITPDATTGIGQWPFEAFVRAMREGISRDGHFLYPAFPYKHYRLLSDDDLADAYAYLMSGPPVYEPATPNRMKFPMNIRPLVSGWNLMFLHTAPFEPAAQQSQQWNRGRYLVEGAGHCGGCHTPLNFLGAEKDTKALSGGVVDGWEAPSLLGLASREKPWSQTQLVEYLQAKVVDNHGTPAGPMRPVSQELARLPQTDVDAIAEYLLSLPASDAKPSPIGASTALTAESARLGHDLFQGACAGCHGGAAPMRAIDGRPALTTTSAVQADKPRNFIKTVLEGIAPTPGEPGPAMPPFAASLNDQQLTALAEFIRHQASPDKPWPEVDATIQALRQETP